MLPNNITTVDDCWQVKRGRVDGHIAVDKAKFPDGIDGLAKKIHDLKLKIGIYSSESGVRRKQSYATVANKTQPREALPALATPPAWNTRILMLPTGHRGESTT